MIKNKKCKGTGKATGHGCGDLIPVERFSKSNRVYGLGISCGCYPKWLYSSKEGLKVLKKATIKVGEPRAGLQKMEKEMKERKSLPTRIKNTVNAVHEYIRERDKYKPCVSCNAPWHPGFHAGHYFKAELYSQLKFHYWNIHGQCPVCNLRKNGNLNEYSNNLPQRIGEKAFKKLCDYAMQDKNDTTFKWDRELLDEIKQTAKDDYKKLVKK